MIKEYQRFAVYFTPNDDTALARFGCSWFENEEKVSARSVGELIESPKRYGFHATLKAPMRLRSGISPEQFIMEVEKLAGGMKQVDLGFLHLERLQNFLALRPENHKNEMLEKLAWKCVTDLDFMRAPLNEAELNKRPGLSEEEKINLKKWGYPYVGNLFRFHMTLTSSLSEQMIIIVSAQIMSELGNTLKDPVVLDALCVFGDPGGNEPFKVVRRFSLRA